MAWPEKKEDAGSERRALGDFNGTLTKAIDEAIKGLLGRDVLESFYNHLDFFGGIKRDELPYHIDVVFHVFEKNFGATVGNVLGRSITKNFYSKLGVEFVERPNYNLLDYVEDAKAKLGIQQESVTKSERRVEHQSPTLMSSE